MLFGQHSLDKTRDEYLRDLALLARDSQTHIFLDTNVLTYLYKLHEAARREFFVWTDSVFAQARLHVPAWAASEYLSYVTAGKLSSFNPSTKEPGPAKKALDVLHQTAALFVDDSLLRKFSIHSDRSTYLRDFRRAIDSLDQYTRVFREQFDPGVIHQELLHHLSQSILDSDLTELCAKASREGGARFEHRLPPGFRDEGKEKNRFGDLIIWFEILSTSLSRKATEGKVLFISNDAKSDWVYAPQLRSELVHGVRKPIPNSYPAISLADPRLVTEFQRFVGHANISICSLASLVEGLSKDSAATFSQLAAAIQIDVAELPTPMPAVGSTGVEPDAEILGEPMEFENFEEMMAVEVAATSTVVPVLPASKEVPGALAPHLQYSSDALCDHQYQAYAPSDINAIIRALKSHNWYTQNPAIVKIQSIRAEEFHPSAWFVLGRNIYQAGCGNAQKAMEFLGALETQLRRFPNETAQHLLAGMLFEIYFDSHGQFRSEAKFQYAEKPLLLAVDPLYGNALEFIRFHLEDYRAQLVFLPGEGKQFRLQLTSTLNTATEEADEAPAHELTSILLNGSELLHAVGESGGQWTTMFRRERISAEDIAELVSDKLAVPRWAITVELQPLLAEHAELVIPIKYEIRPTMLAVGN